MPSENASRLDMPLGEAIYSLRAIRRLRPDPIPDEDLRTVLDAARQAPNGGNQQSRHFLVLRDQEVRRAFEGTITTLHPSVEEEVKGLLGYPRRSMSCTAFRSSIRRAILGRSTASR